ncbi:uncharacterized protein TRUGW13939_04464 [Talaromyces rugulosus]|uniref:Pseudouridine synthase I TruA alpha/beta domain-containing protein n=1 Tax=Talaromyces rugulosus TaxID=121627 RepID=A0A7H8QTP4_TALRU|nr:uncharacterized protein TRUGW13939_04464 [Talaromyces rugulosus]QKX57352.1 hypothetical protein TRUGW13939_04464 [Talaromyces rugulosus]
MAEPSPDYTTWSNTSLIGRIAELERQLHSQNNQLPASSSSVSTPAVLETSDTPIVPQLPPQTLQPGDSTTFQKSNQSSKKQRDIDPSKYHTRHIALKFAYLGQRYNGYEHTNNNKTPLPTIEEELWKALRLARLIFPASSSGLGEDYAVDKLSRAHTLDWEGCQYSKCGRTDRGVSAFGQVIGIRVRSARPKKQAKTTSNVEDIATDIENLTIGEVEPSQSATDQEPNVFEDVDDDWDDIRDELPYIQILNNMLPSDIRILAWCPHPPPDFDARFSCRERQYKYFFTQPAYSPTPGKLGFLRSAAHHRGISEKKIREGWLDIEAMREGCKHFMGKHDFRNFCKVDTSKQINNFERMIYQASIELADPKTDSVGYLGTPEFRPSDNTPDVEHKRAVNEDWPSKPLVYTFTLSGSAFLWHQVRHMVEILFLIGQGVESPSIIPELLDVSKNPCKPTYEMASDAPLVLWDCSFPDIKSGSRADALEWVYCGDPRQTDPASGKGDGKFGPLGLIDSLWTTWRKHKMDEILALALLDLTVNQGDPSFIQNEAPKKPFRSQKLFHGGNEGKLGGVYVPVMQKKTTATVEVQNARYLATLERKALRLQEEGLADV